MKLFREGCLAAAALLATVGVAAAQAPQPPQFPNMTFFITSTPGQNGANFGGIEGADAHCQTLATRAGAGAKTWRAYLSQQAMGGKPAINARDRIGKGPWVNAAGVQIAASVEDLHDPAKANINVNTGLTETNRMVMSRLFVVNYHDILTGSNADGTAPAGDKDLTCGNWTKGAEGSAMVGHHDRMGLDDSRRRNPGTPRIRPAVATTPRCARPAATACSTASPNRRAFSSRSRPDPRACAGHRRR